MTDAQDPMKGVPRYAYVKNIGQVRILNYLGDGKFEVLDKHDEHRVYNRDQLSFRKERRRP